GGGGGKAETASGEGPCPRLGEHARDLEELVRVTDPGRSSFLHQRAECPLVTRDRTGMSGSSLRAGTRLAHLQHRHAYAALGAERERLRQPRTVAVLLEEERDRADAVAH